MDTASVKAYHAPEWCHNPAHRESNGQEMSLETITVTRTSDREYSATRTQGLDRTSEIRSCRSWSALYDQLCEWHVDEDGIQSIVHQLTRTELAVVQVGVK